MGVSKDLNKILHSFFEPPFDKQPLNKNLDKGLSEVNYNFFKTLINKSLINKSLINKSLNEVIYSFFKPYFNIGHVKELNKILYNFFEPPLNRSLGKDLYEIIHHFFKPLFCKIFHK